MVPHLLSPSPPFGDRRRRRRRKSRIASRRRNVSGSSSNSIIIKTKSSRRHHRRRLQWSDWSDFPSDVLERLQRKSAFADAIRCRAVCSHWRSVTQSHISSSLNSPPPPPAAAHAQLPPLIMWNHQFFDPGRPGKKLLYNLNRKSKRFFLSREVGCLVGYSHGWFLFNSAKEENILVMFHPFLFSSASARFPPIVTPNGFHPIIVPIRNLCDDFRVVLWADPILSSNRNYGIVVIHPLYKNLIFAKSGATQFTDLVGTDTRWFSPWEDIICFQNLIFAVSLSYEGEHHMEAWDCTSADEDASPPVKVLDFQPKFSSGNGPLPRPRSTLHLVESQGELLLVSIQRPDSEKLCTLSIKRGVSYRKLFVLARSPDTVRVYKMDFQEMKWVQMQSLGDRLLFIMEQQNLSVSTQEFPQYKRNTVYFNHKISARCISIYCVGVFNMEDGSMTEIWPV